MSVPIRNDERRWQGYVQKFGNSVWAAAFWGIVGCSTLTAAASLVIKNMEWKAGVLLFGFGVAVYYMAYNMRTTSAMRDQIGWFRPIVGNFSVAFTVVLAGTFLDTKDVNFQLLVGVNVFVLVELAKPVSDYGLLQSFLLLGIATAIKHGSKRKWQSITAAVAQWLLLSLWNIYFLYYYVRSQQEVVVPVVDQEDRRRIGEDTQLSDMENAAAAAADVTAEDISGNNEPEVTGRTPQHAAVEIDAPPPIRVRGAGGPRIKRN